MDTSDKNRFSFRSRAQRLLPKPGHQFSWHGCQIPFQNQVCKDICGLQIIKMRHIAFPRLSGESMADLENLLWVMKEQFAHILLALLGLFWWWEFRQVHYKIPPDFSGASHIDKSQDWAMGVVAPCASVKDLCKLVRVQESALDSCKCWDMQKIWTLRTQKCSKRKTLIAQSVSTSAPSASNPETTIVEREKKEKHDRFWLFSFFLCGQKQHGTLEILWQIKYGYQKSLALMFPLARKMYSSVVSSTLFLLPTRAKVKAHRFRRYA